MTMPSPTKVLTFLGLLATPMVLLSLLCVCIPPLGRLLSEMFVFAGWDYDLEITAFDDGMGTILTDFGMAAHMAYCASLFHAAAARTAARSPARRLLRLGAALFALYAVSVCFGGVAHAAYGFGRLPLPNPIEGAERFGLSICRPIETGWSG